MWQTCYPSLPENWDFWVIHDHLHVKICRHLGLEAAEFVTSSESLLIAVPKMLITACREVVILLLYQLLCDIKDRSSAHQNTVHDVKMHSILN